jgi:dihydrofolate reductase
MNSITCHISISLDGFVAGPNQSLENPIGEGGMRLHEWAFKTFSWRQQQGLEGGERRADSEVVDEVVQDVGAYIMGRKMFGGGEGAWDHAWTGWWGEDPPYHAPVFVLTHHRREPVVMQGGTTFTFVTDGPESALARARAAAGERTSRSRAALAPCSNTSQLECLTSFTCTSSRSSLEGESGCSTTSAIPISNRSV